MDVPRDAAKKVVLAALRIRDAATQRKEQPPVRMDVVDAAALVVLQKRTRVRKKFVQRNVAREERVVEVSTIVAAAVRK